MEAGVALLHWYVMRTKMSRKKSLGINEVFFKIFKDLTQDIFCSFKEIIKRQLSLFFSPLTYLIKE